jgi:hypothetical protein
MRACLKLIFSHLDLHELPAVARVSKEWCWNYWRDRDSLLIDVISKIYAESQEFKWLFYVNDPRVCQEAKKGLAAFQIISDGLYVNFLRESAKIAMEKKINRVAIIHEISLLKKEISSIDKRYFLFYDNNNVTTYLSYRLVYRGEFNLNDNYPLRSGIGTSYDESDGLIEFSGNFDGGLPKSGWIYSKVTGEPCYFFRRMVIDHSDDTDTICIERGNCIKSEVSKFFWRYFEPGYATISEPLCFHCRNRRSLKLK